MIQKSVARRSNCSRQRTVAISVTLRPAVMGAGPAPASTTGICRYDLRGSRNSVPTHRSPPNTPLTRACVYIIPGSGHPSEPSFHTTDSARTITSCSRSNLANAAASFRIGSRIACGTCPFMGDSRVDINVNLDSFSRSDFDRLRLCTHVPGPRPCTSL
jgi:hypothetical protein